MAFSKLVSIITARGGSKRLPGKNIKDLCGKPLIAHTIEAALQCNSIDGCYVSTEDASIASVSREFGADVIYRPDVLASDSASSVDVIFHALMELETRLGVLPKAFVLLQPTSPLRSVASLEGCIQGWKESEATSAVSISKMEHHPYKCFLQKGQSFEPLIDYATLSCPVQNLPSAYRTNGAIYIVKSASFLKEKSFYPFPMYHFQMSLEESIDIDTEIDFVMAEILMKKRDALK